MKRQPFSSNLLADTAIVEHVLLQENQELEALVSLMESENEDSPSHLPPSTEYGSDEEEYEEIFAEVLNSFNSQGPDHGESRNLEQDQDMDLSNG